MTKRRVAILVLEVSGAIIALCVIAMAFLYWRLQSGPVSLALAAPIVESLIEDTVGGDVSASIDAITLSVGDETGVLITLAGVQLDGAVDGGHFFLPHIHLSFTPGDLVAGEIGPRRISLEEPHLRIVRRGDRRFTLDYGDGVAKDRPANVFTSLTGGKYFREAFEKVELKGAKVQFLDERTGRKWVADHADAVIERTGERYLAKIDGTFNIEGKEASLLFDAWYDPETEIISSKLVLDQAPLGDLLATFFGESANIVSAPLTGRATLDISSDGRILSSYLSGKAGEGTVKIGGRDIRIQGVEAAAAFDPQTNEFDIEAFNLTSEVASIRITGNVTLDQDNDNRSELIGFDLVGNAPSLNVDGLFDGAIMVDEFSLVGDFHRQTGRVDISAATVSIGENIFSGQGVFSPEFGLSPAISATASATGRFDKDGLLALWPLRLAGGGRSFVMDRVFDASFYGLDFEMDLAAGAIGVGGKIPNEAMALRFNADNATIHYVPGMTPLREVNGNGELRGNSFRFKAGTGRVGDIKLSSGEVDIPNLGDFQTPTYYRFKANGDTDEILGVLDQAPLSLLSSTPLDPEQFSGQASLDIEIMRPNALVVYRNQYEYRGSATFNDLSITGFYGDIGLSDGVGSLALRPKSMTINGDALLGDTPISLVWDQFFFAKENRSRMTVSGTADSSTGDLLGIPTRKFVRGPVPFSANAVGDIGALRAIEIDADFSQADVLIHALGWTKNASAPMATSVNIELLEDEIFLKSIQIDGEGVKISGQATVDRNQGIKTVGIDTFKLMNSADLTVGLHRGDDNGLHLTLAGKYLNLPPIMDEVLLKRDPSKSKDQPWITAGQIRIDRVTAKNDVIYRDISVDWRSGERGFDEFDLAARGGDGLPVTASLKLTGAQDGPSQFIQARSDNIGDFLGGFFGVSSVNGGQGVVEFFRDDAKSGGFSHGQLEARDLKIVNAPLLAKIFAAGSLEGLNSLLNDNGIEISKAFADFTVDGASISISDARAAGPSVGVTGRGELRDRGREVFLSGAVAPVYQVNSFLGKAPLIGDLFVNREGEGVLALTYDVRGAALDPQVSVNPLSAFAPGFLRRVFDRSESADTNLIQNDPPSPEIEN